MSIRWIKILIFPISCSYFCILTANFKICEICIRFVYDVNTIIRVCSVNLNFVNDWLFNQFLMADYD